MDASGAIYGIWKHSEQNRIQVVQTTLLFPFPGPTGSPPDHRAKYARDGKDPGAALDQRVVCVFTMVNMVNEHKPRPPRNHSLATRWAGLKHSQTESSLVKINPLTGQPGFAVTTAEFIWPEFQRRQ